MRLGMMAVERIFCILCIFCIYLEYFAYFAHFAYLQVLRLEMVGDREVTEDEFMAIVAALPKLRVSTIVTQLEKHADGAISPLCCFNLWSVNDFLLELCRMQNA